MIIRALRLVRSLRRQDGMSLVMAVGILGVLSVSGASVVYYTNTNARSAEFSKQNASAYDLAEAGINEMIAVLSKPENDALQKTLLPTTTTTYDTGTVTWSGTLDHSTQTWSITSTGRIKNPTAATKEVTRTLTAKVPVVPTVTQPLNNPAWDYMFSTRTGNTCDQTLNNNVGGASRFYVMGNLCISNNASLSPSNLVVKGNLTLDNNTSIGSSSSRVETYIGKDCVYGQSATPSNVVGACGEPDAPAGYSDSTLTGSKNIWARYVNGAGQSVNGVGSTVPVLAIPEADFAKWYTHAMPGPGQTCTASSGSPPVFDNNGIRDNSVPLQNLTPAASYTCRVGPAAITDSTTLAAAVNASATTLTVSSATGFPTYGTFTIKVDNEYMKVTGGAGTNTWTVSRAQQGTTAASHNQGAIVTHVDPATGEISWNATTRILTVSGTIFIDGSAKIDNRLLNQYNGQAALYLSGTMYFDGKLCAGVSGTTCDFDNWNPNTEMLTIVTERSGVGGLAAAGNGVQFENGAQFQGALYAHNDGAVSFGNNAKSDGPIVASHIILSNNVETSSFPNIVEVPVGMPGNKAVYAQPNPPQLYSG